VIFEVKLKQVVGPVVVVKELHVLLVDCRDLQAFLFRIRLQSSLVNRDPLHLNFKSLDSCLRIKLKFPERIFIFFLIKLLKVLFVKVKDLGPEPNYNEVRSSVDVAKDFLDIENAKLLLLNIERGATEQIDF